ncbi:MAG TPA: YicC/YloC family endoribonuclease [Chitinophagales bacterium]
MLHSMTGFGKADGTYKRSSLLLEIRSLNSAKGLDVSVKLPSRYRSAEAEFRNIINTRLLRGKIDVSLSLIGVADASTINIELAKQLFAQFKNMADELKADTTHLFSSVLQMPEIHSATELEVEEDELNFCSSLLNKAIDQLLAFRTKEGESILSDVQLRLKNIAASLQLVIVEDKRRLGEIRSKMIERMETFIPKEKIDANRFEQEVVFYLEKLDINEEISRLTAHLKHFDDALKSDDNSMGKKLNFITQEIGREINTIGSKANDFAVQKLVVGMKDELEKIKEQSNNIL